MEEKLVTVAVFQTPYEAGLAKAKLEASGIPAFVADEFTIGSNPLYSNALGGVKVQVPASCAEEASELLAVNPPSGMENREASDSGNDTHRTTSSSVWLYVSLAAALAAVAVYAYLALQRG
jgi:hypothetical protein